MKDMEDIICIGTLNAKSDDRSLDRANLKSLQYIIGGEAKEFRPMSSVGEHGISAIAQVGDTVFVATGWDLWEVPSAGGFELRRVDVDSLKHIHELSVIGGRLWIASTGSGELVCYDPVSKSVTERVLLLPRSAADQSSEVSNTYHCNQAFEGDNGELLALVHHVDGRQHKMSIASKVMLKLKQQGNGGVINARTGEVLLGNLSGPHSVRKLNDGSWLICDSGRSAIVICDPMWNIIKTCDTKGWARGVAVGERYVYVGISETRKRYLNLMPTATTVPNMILVYDPKSWEIVHELLMRDIEQVADVCMVTPLMRSWLGLC